MTYYGVRNGKIDLSDLKISFNKFRQFFLDTYAYFEDKQYFKLAFEGHHYKLRLMKPSPEAFFINILETKMFILFFNMDTNLIKSLFSH